MLEDQEGGYGYGGLGYVNNYANKKGTGVRCLAKTGAGEGNRTLVVSLGSFCSTIELHPRSVHSTRVCAGLANLMSCRCEGKCDGRLFRGVMAYSRSDIGHGCKL